VRDVFTDGDRVVGESLSDASASMLAFAKLDALTAQADDLSADAMEALNASISASDDGGLTLPSFAALCDALGVSAEQPTTAAAALTDGDRLPLRIVAGVASDNEKSITSGAARRGPPRGRVGAAEG
jgi:hypothetical protein